MRKAILLLFITLGCLLPAFSQTHDSIIKKMMTMRKLAPSDILYNSAELIPKLYNEGKKDTINDIIDYYERNYGNEFMLDIYVVLISIKNRTFRETLPDKSTIITDKVKASSDSEYYKNEIIGILDWYRQNNTIKTDSVHYSEDTRNVYGVYFDFVKSLSADLLKIPDLQPQEKILCTYFAYPSDSVLKEMYKPAYNDTRLQKALKKDNEKYNKISGLHLTLNTGLWMPQQNLKILGNHPYMGWSVGGRWNKFSADLTLNFSFLRAPHHYKVLVDTMAYTTNYFSGGYYGFDLGYELFRLKRHELDILAGLAYSEIDPFNSLTTSNNDLSNFSLSSYNFNIGLGYKFYYRLQKVVKKEKDTEKTNSYFSLELKYNFNQYDNPGGTNLSGNCWTVAFVWGGFHQKLKGNNLFLK